ncbi:hypothetical protein CBOM_07996 [Ceraceosorus bombacis]|uniref:Uncharacterized protein n=1 Tax=Ceraceosorus bombacis TaxID=401625 RepID=A0A0P1BKA8_9BASI|nr:hypothetical protein CBOM_07996 [Ceraceosorus bombacis]
MDTRSCREADVSSVLQLNSPASTARKGLPSGRLLHASDDAQKSGGNCFASMSGRSAQVALSLTH